MTNRQDMLELAARVEAATGPDRELDALICEMVALPLCAPPDCCPEVLKRIIGRAKSGAFGGDDPDVAFYTASLDAAMTLVPEGFLDHESYSFAIEHDRWDEGLWTARFDEPGDECGHGDTILGTAATPALALTAAALKARAHTKGEE